MSEIIEIKIAPEHIDDNEFIENILSKKWQAFQTEQWHIVRKSIDARKKKPFYLLRVQQGKRAARLSHKEELRSKDVKDAQEVHIIGAGPAGYFAALECISLGLKPIILERGKDVQRRRRDLKAIQQDHIVHPHSNYCFGEGGAGTYSDGKLYTRSHKRGRIQTVLEMLYDHGAPEDILIDAHPHIGSNKLPKIIAELRDTILAAGGDIHFDSFVTDLDLEDGQIVRIQLESGKTYSVEKLILATGHSARDIFYLLDEKGIRIEAKDFAIGLRIEHPQKFIDARQYNMSPRSENLPAAPYRLNTQVAGNGVFSFCMCPGGLIVPAATAAGELVVNGMSLSKRDSPYANSGLVTSISVDELASHGYSGVFACVDFQREIEQKLFKNGDGSQKVPAQRVRDFVQAKISESLPDSSYIPGLYSAPLHSLLPSFVYDRLRQGILDFDKKMKDYIHDDAIVVGIESRTSSPIRIPRDRESFTHPDVKGLYPCGEGAGYAGGILSACMDGIRVARATVKQ